MGIELPGDTIMNALRIPQYAADGTQKHLAVNGNRVDYTAPKTGGTFLERVRRTENKKPVKGKKFAGKKKPAAKKRKTMSFESRQRWFKHNCSVGITALAACEFAKVADEHTVAARQNLQKVWRGMPCNIKLDATGKTTSVIAAINEMLAKPSKKSVDAVKTAKDELLATAKRPTAPRKRRRRAKPSPSDMQSKLKSASVDLEISRLIKRA